MTAGDINLMLTFGFFGLFMVGMILFMMYQEKKLKDLEDQAIREEELHAKHAQKSHS